MLRSEISEFISIIQLKHFYIEDEVEKQKLLEIISRIKLRLDKNQNEQLRLVQPLEDIEESVVKNNKICDKKLKNVKDLSHLIIQNALNMTLNEVQEERVNLT